MTHTELAVAPTTPTSTKKSTIHVPVCIGKVRASDMDGTAMTIRATSTYTRFVKSDIECYTEAVVRHFLNIYVDSAARKFT